MDEDDVCITPASDIQRLACANGDDLHGNA